MNELFKTSEVDTQIEYLKGDFYLKGLIYVIDEESNFEVLYESLFYTGLEKDGYFLSQGDIDIYLEHELKSIDWGFTPEVDRHYSVLYKFSITPTSCWTDCGYEYDSEIECLDLHIIPVSDKANELYKKPMYQLENAEG